MADDMSPVLSTVNRYDPIGDEPVVDFHPRQIVHGRLRIVPALPDPNDPNAPAAPELRFQVGFKNSEPRKPHEPDVSQAEIDAYVRDVADGKVAIEFHERLLPTSPFDIPVTMQCWVVLELDPHWSNWQFQAEHVGCTTKEPYGGKNAYLRHVYPTRHPQNGGVVSAGAIKADGSRVMYFGVVQRAVDESNYINLHTDFIQPKVGDAKHRLQVIFDPDVKNEGGFPIP